MAKRKPILSLLDICILGTMTAILEVSKKALEFLPNIELISLLLIVFTMAYGKRVILCSMAFTFIEISFWGIHTWVIMYLYIWPLLIIAVDLTRSHASYFFHCIMTTVYGLVFGALCSIPYLFIGGPSMMFAFWIAGIPFDIRHGIGNLVLCLILYKPLMAALDKIPILKRGRKEHFHVSDD